VFVVFRQTSSSPPMRREPSLPEERPPAEIAPEPLLIEGPWQLAFPEGHGAPPQITLDRLTSWPDVDDAGVRHFSGIATYRTTFACPAAVDARAVRATLDLGRVHELAEVRLNGRLLGIRWHPPYHLDATGILRPGENHLEIRVANLWHNRLVADAALPAPQRITRMVPETHYTRLRAASLVPSGLLGPVRIVMEKPSALGSQTRN
jgi:hypothetical protein